MEVGDRSCSGIDCGSYGVWEVENGAGREGVDSGR